MKYKISSIPKGNGSYRHVYIVSPERRKYLRSLLPKLQEIHTEFDKSAVSYAFQKDKNCALLASQHIGYKYTLSLDVKDFFDNITESHVEKYIPKNLLSECLINGNPKQGLPTSPLIASIALLPVDEEIEKIIHSLGISIVYTRYADDLIFSFDNPRVRYAIHQIVKTTLKKYKLSLNEKKIKFQSNANGRRIITGIGVDNTGIYATRKIKKKIRAAIHQANYRSLNGLMQWSQCKMPNALQASSEIE